MFRAVGQEFSNLSVNKNYLGEFFKNQIGGTLLKASNSKSLIWGKKLLLFLKGTSGDHDAATGHITLKDTFPALMYLTIFEKMYKYR